MDLYLKYLTRELEGEAKPVESIKWGTETSRLQPPASFVVSLVETGSPPDIPSSPAVNGTEQQEKLGEKVAPVSPVSPFESCTDDVTQKLWLYPPTNAGGKDNIFKDVTFSKETSEKLHAVAKKHGYTMTQLFTALFILAHTEAEFRAAGKQGSARYQELSQSFHDATHYIVAWTFINHVSALSAYRS